MVSFNCETILFEVLNAKSGRVTMRVSPISQDTNGVKVRDHPVV